jgi:hypothetical protein
MANTFMIEVRFNSRPLFANVYVNTRGQLTYHVNFIGDQLPEFLRDPIVLHYQDGKLCALEPGIPDIIIKKISEGIDKKLG